MHDSLPVVSVTQVTNLQQDLVRCLAGIGGVRRYVRPGDRVLVKPNFGVPRRPETAVVTDPELVFALVDLLLDAGARVAIGESCVTGFALAEIWDVLDVPRRARERGVELIDLRQDAPVEVRVPDPLVVPSLRIARRALEADLIVNVPKLKTHVETTVTIALKNLKGVLTGNEKARLHQLDTPVEAALEAAVVDLNSVMPPTLNVVDGVLAMEGGGPLEGTPVPLGALIAGPNRVAVDAVCCQLMAIDPAEVRHLRLAADRGLGPLTLDEIRLVGDDIGSLRRPFSRPDAMEFAVPAIRLVEAGACSGCAGGIRQALRGLREHPVACGDTPRITVFVGAKVEGPGCPEDVVVGNCAIRHMRSGVPVPGCPPLFGKMRIAMLRSLAGPEGGELVEDGDRRLES